ncbi:MAG TPA: hypothetical protein VFE62_29045 [Gemmataceae bacterium]|nr:hypothetical protein [Gemmataceae bacterium]
MRATIILWCVGIIGLLGGASSLHATGDKGGKKADSVEALKARAREGARLEFQAKVKAMQAEVYAALAGEKEAEARAQFVNRLLSHGAAYEEDYLSALHTLVEMRKERAEKEKILKLLVESMRSELRRRK